LHNKLVWVGYLLTTFHGFVKGFYISFLCESSLQNKCAFQCAPDLVRAGGFMWVKTFGVDARGTVLFDKLGVEKQSNRGRRDLFCGGGYATP
jgi:hypothetical protein